MELDKKPKKAEVGGVLFALFIILLGAFSLMTDTSILTALFRLVALWPVLVIGFGVWLIFKNFEQEKIGAVILAIILVGALYFAFFRVQPQMEAFDQGEIPSGITNLDVYLELWAGEYFIGSTSENLYMTEGQGDPLETEFFASGSTGYLDIAVREEAISPFTQPGNEYSIFLSEQIPLTLEVDSGVISCSFDFSRLEVEEFNLDGGVSSLEIIFGEASTEANIDMGISSINIKVPTTVGVEIVTDGLVSLSVPSDWVKTDDGYRSPNYNTAQYRIVITSTVGIGSIHISYV